MLAHFPCFSPPFQGNMGLRFRLALVVAISVTVSAINAKNIKQKQDDEELAAVTWLSSLDEEYSLACNAQMVARWDYITNVTDESSSASTLANEVYATFRKDAWERVVAEFGTDGSFSNWQSYSDSILVRKIGKLLDSAKDSILTGSDLTNYLNLQSEMETIYATATICNLDGSECGLALEPQITEIMATSRDYEELTHVWKAWRDVSGKLMREKYIEFYGYINQAAQLNGYADGSEMWVSPYDTDDFKQQIAAVWEEMEPWYKKIHAYVRRRLVDFYGEDVIDPTGPIPANVLGNPWAQQWGNIADLTIPYPDASSVNVNEALNEQGYTVDQVFRTAEEFFTSLGLEPMTDTFWEKSMLEKPDDREVVCHASAEDFCLGPGSDDFRIKMCTVINQEDFVTVHHEMGHIQYFQQYRDLPFIFRDGANPGFHEAVGDTLALSVSTPKHLQTIGLLSNYEESVEADINYLLSMALDKIAFLPFAYVLDRWRWDVFSGEVTSDELNGHWWNLRESIQGVKSPVERSEDDFDPGAKYHVPGNVPYVRYFVSFIVQFQFYESLCKAAGQYDPENPEMPLYKCDFYQNLEAGKLMGDMLKLGYSMPWSDAMEAITGQRNMSAASLKAYFEPLEAWLDVYLAESGDCVGWGDDCTPKSS